MDRVKILERKIYQVIEKINALQDEKEKLVNEIKFLEEENQRSKHLSKENDKLKEEKKLVIVRIERLLKKINSLTEK